MQLLIKRRSFPIKVLAGVLIVVTTMAMALPQKSWAMLAPAQSNDVRSADLKTIQIALESETVRQRLTELKLTPDQINSRLSKLSNAQIHQTAMQIRTVNPGGDAGLSILVTVLVIGILVGLFMYVFKRI